MLLLTDGRERELFDKMQLFDSIEIFDNISNYWNEFSWFRGIYQFFYKIYLYFILAPLFYLYINGPSFLGFGFWKGKKFSEICSEISGVKDTLFWEISIENQLKCKELIYTQFYSICILIIIIIYFIILYTIIKIIIKIFPKIFYSIKYHLSKIFHKQ